MTKLQHSLSLWIYTNNTTPKGPDVFRMSVSLYFVIHGFHMVAWTFLAHCSPLVILSRLEQFSPKSSSSVAGDPDTNTFSYIGCRDQHRINCSRPSILWMQSFSMFSNAVGGRVLCELGEKGDFIGQWEIANLLYPTARLLVPCSFVPWVKYDINAWYQRL